MNKIKKLFKKWDIGLLAGIGLAILGVILMILPGSSLTTVCLFLGIGTAVKGFTKLFSYIKAKQTSAERNSDLISAILILLAAFVLIAHPEKLLSVIPVLIGIGVLVYGISGIFKRGGLFSKATAIITIIVGAGIIGSPFAFAEAVTSILGVALIIVGVIVIINARNTLTLQIEPPADDGYTEVEFTDVE